MAILDSRAPMMAWCAPEGCRRWLRDYGDKNAARLTYRLNQCIDDLALFEGGRLGFTKIDSSAISGRTLSVAIPKGSMTATQRAAIESAIARARAFDINLVITEF